MNSISIIALVIIAAVILWLIYNRVKNGRRSSRYYDDQVNVIYSDYNRDSSTVSPANLYNDTTATESSSGSWENDDTNAEIRIADSTDLFSGSGESIDADADSDIGFDFPDDSTDTD